MIKYTNGNLLEADVEALVNTVNTVGVMGKGIALQFKQAFPDNYKAYKKAFDRGELQTGKILVFRTNQLTNPKYILNFPTKKHWRGKAKLEHIDAGLEDLRHIIVEYDIKSIAIPPLGCGFGKLDWKDVKPRIEAAITGLANLHAIVYEPKGTPEPEKMKIGTKRPNMTVGRAAIIKLIHEYSIAGYKLSLLEIQKLAFLLQSMGEPLRFNFVKQQYGPYAENLNFVLQHIEGHFIRGYGDRSSRRAAIRLLPGAYNEAEAFLKNYPETSERIDEVINIIRGFETPYGMELLATVYWLAKENPQVEQDYKIAAVGFEQWNSRKQEHFRTEHIKIAWNRLKEEAWTFPS